MGPFLRVRRLYQHDPVLMLIDFILIVFALIITIACIRYYIS